MQEDPTFAPWYFSDWDDAFVFLTSTPGQYIDVCEICGGKGGVSRIAIRRRLKTGQNFDICVGFDLTNKDCVKQLW